MRRLIASLTAATAVVFAVGFIMAADATPTVEPTARSVVKMVIPNSGHGSGVHLGNGFILTAGHVTEGADWIDVVDTTGDHHHGEILWFNHAYDVSLVHIDDYADIQAAPLSCKDPKVGDAIRLEGSPSDVDFAIAWGRVSAFGKVGYENIDGKGMWKRLITLDITAAPGDSGGPIYDEKTGEVIGILVSGMIIPMRGVYPYSYMVGGREICHIMGRV